VHTVPPCGHSRASAAISRIAVVSAGSVLPRKKKPRPPSVEMSGPKFTSVAVGDDASTAWQCQTHLHLTAFRYFAMCWLAQKGCFKDSKAVGP
jgi:hypothetical protein